MSLEIAYPASIACITILNRAHAGLGCYPREGLEETGGGRWSAAACSFQSCWKKPISSAGQSCVSF